MATHKEIKNRVKESISQARSVLRKMEDMSNGSDLELLAAFLFTDELYKSLSAGDLSTKSIERLLEQHINDINDQQE